MRTPLTFLIAAVVCAAPGVTAQAFAGQEPAQLQAVVILADAADQAKLSQGGITQKPPAQTTKPKPKPTPKLPIGLRVFGGAEVMAMAASSTFEAQGGSSMVIGYGAGGEVLNLWRKLFVRAGYWTGSVDGTRGFVIDGDFVSNGIPLKLGVQNIELGAGWRSYLKPSWVAWYIYGGLNKGTNSQESPDPEPGDNDSKSGNGFVGAVGFEFALQKKAKNPLFLGVEGAYRSVGGVLGESGGSEGFGESDLGGAVVRVLVGIRFKK